MSADLRKLTPAPWVLGGDLSVNGEWWPDGAAEFIVLAREALDVMMRRGWGVKKAWYGGWEIIGGGSLFEESKRESWGDDPFTALVEADKWYRENVEGK